MAPIAALLPSGDIEIDGDGVLLYDVGTADIYQHEADFSGEGMLAVDGTSHALLLGGYGDVNVGFSPGATISVVSGTLVAGADQDADWSGNGASLYVYADAVFDLGDDGQLVGSMLINQQNAPAGPVVDEVAWQSLGQFTAQTASLTVRTLGTVFGPATLGAVRAELRTGNEIHVEDEYEVRLLDGYWIVEVSKVS